MSWLYCHHSDEDIKHLIVWGTVTKDKKAQDITVKADHARLRNTLPGRFFRWSYLYVMNLETGEEYWFNDRESRNQAQQWIFDPLLRAIKVAELNKKRKRLTQLNKVVKLTKQKALK